MASLGYCVSVLHLSRDPVSCPECSRGVYTAPFGSEFEVGGAFSEDELRRRASRGAPGGFSRELAFVAKNSVAPFTCSHFLANSSCRDADEDVLLRSVLEQISTGVESESHVRRKEAIVRRHLLPLSEKKIPRVPVIVFDESSVLFYL